MAVFESIPIFERDNSNLLFDYKREGGFDLQGQIKKLFGEEAFRQSITMWLESEKGEVLRQPSRGGYVTQYLQKSMTDATADAIAVSIRNGFEQDYTPLVTLKSVIVTPDYDNQEYLIDMVIDSTTLKLSTNFQTRLSVNN